jgi:predicted nuclease with TOPRIM domain
MKSRLSSLQLEIVSLTNDKETLISEKESLAAEKSELEASLAKNISDGERELKKVRCEKLSLDERMTLLQFQNVDMKKQLSESENLKADVHNQLMEITVRG